ncbi:MAG: Ig-like domain-containing protein [Pedobacter sp.]
MINLFWSGVAILLLLSGCGWDGTPTRNDDFTPPTSIEIVADSASIAAHTSTKLSVINNYTRDITDQATWSSNSLTVAKFADATSPNRVTGLAPGTAILTATVRGVKATITLTVTPATIDTMTITPVNPSIAKGLTTQFTVIGKFSDSTTQDLTYDAKWASSVSDVATVSDDVGSKGFAQSRTVGATTISAAFDGVSDSTLLTVKEKELQSITVTPADSSITGLSKTVSFIATGRYTDGTTADITSTAVWASSKPEIATITTPGGVATTVAAGTTSISATLNGVIGKTDLKVTVPILQGLTIDTSSQILTVGTSHQFKITATFTDATTQDVTDICDWSSTDVSVATVTTTGSGRGLVTGVVIGSATISATYDGQTKTAIVTVQ